MEYFIYTKSTISSSNKVGTLSMQYNLNFPSRAPGALGAPRTSGITGDVGKIRNGVISLDKNYTSIDIGEMDLENFKAKTTTAKPILVEMENSVCDSVNFRLKAEV